MMLVKQSFILFSVVTSIVPQRLLFPNNGYFDEEHLQPFDAIYLNMLAQANLMYGGVTLEELDRLGEARRKIPYEDGAPRTAGSGYPTSSTASSKFLKAKTPLAKPKEPFRRDDPLEDDNPFESIATRAPARGRGGRRPPSAVTETRPDRPPRRPSARVPGIKTTRPLFIPLNESTIFRSRKNRQFTRSSPHDDDVFGRRRPKFKFLEQEPAFARQRQLVSGLNEESRPNRLNGKLSVANLLNTEDLRKDDSVGQQLIVNLPTRPFPNNPFSLIDIRQPTILPLPKPPESTN